MVTNYIMSGENKPSKSWCFTLNNPTKEEEATICALECTRGRAALERGESGTVHVQGMVTFSKATRLGPLKKILPRAHWERAIAVEASLNYCAKEGNIFWDVDNRTQGKRTDLQEAATLIKERGIAALVEENPSLYLHYANGCEKLAARLQTPRRFVPEVWWIWGGTGIGKSYWVNEREPSLWISGKNLQWWDGYENQEAVLFDDFRGDFCTYHWLLRLLDRYPVTVEIKGATRQFNSKRIYITCPVPPDEVYKTREDVGQLLRRLTHIGTMNNRQFVTCNRSDGGNTNSVTVEEPDIGLIQDYENLSISKADLDRHG